MWQYLTLNGRAEFETEGIDPLLNSGVQIQTGKFDSTDGGLATDGSLLRSWLGVFLQNVFWGKNEAEVYHMQAS